MEVSITAVHKTDRQLEDEAMDTFLLEEKMLEKYTSCQRGTEVDPDLDISNYYESELDSFWDHRKAKVSHIRRVRGYNC